MLALVGLEDFLHASKRVAAITVAHQQILFLTQRAYWGTKKASNRHKDRLDAFL